MVHMATFFLSSSICFFCLCSSAILSAFSKSEHAFNRSDISGANPISSLISPLAIPARIFCISARLMISLPLISSISSCNFPIYAKTLAFFSIFVPVTAAEVLEYPAANAACCIFPPFFTYSFANRSCLRVIRSPPHICHADKKSRLPLNKFSISHSPCLSSTASVPNSM